MRKISILFLLLIISLIFISCNDDKSKSDESIKKDEVIPLTVSAAVSLTDALEEMKDFYEKDNKVNLTFNRAGSGTLTQQIQQGAPVDLFISANQDWMDILEDEEVIISETRVDVTGNKLVVIASESSQLMYDSINQISNEDIDHIAIGNPDSVPAGKYTRDMLINLGLYSELEDSLVLAKDVRQVLTYVETGNVDVGFVYESDALSSDMIKILASVDHDLHKPIIYPAAVIAGTKQEEAAIDFLNYIQTEEAQNILAQHGFTK